MGEQIKSGNYFWRRILGGNFAQILRKIPSFSNISNKVPRKNYTLKTHWILSQGLNVSGLLPLGQKPIWEFQKDLKVSILKSLFVQATCFDGGDFKRGFNLQINIWSEAWIHWNDDDRGNWVRKWKWQLQENVYKDYWLKSESERLCTYKIRAEKKALLKIFYFEFDLQCNDFDFVELDHSQGWRPTLKQCSFHFRCSSMLTDWPMSWVCKISMSPEGALFLRRK